LAFAGQVSAAIQNARLYSEVVRLYNLTDEALAERVQQLQALLDSTHEGVLMFDTTQRIVLVNRVAADLLGQQRQALLDRALVPSIVSAALGYEEGALTALLQQLSTGSVPVGRSRVYETRISRENVDARHFIERNEAPVLADDSHLLGWLMVLRDVTEEVERSEWRLNATRMIVHDLRNPITTLSSTVELIENRLTGEVDPEVYRLTQSAQRGISDMLDMVDSLMDVTRIEAGQLVVDAEAMRLPPLLERVVEHMQPLALQKHIALCSTMPADLPAVWGDAEILRRVLVNLLDNALKFTPAGGQVMIQLAPDLQTGDDDSAGVLCSIEDNGPGIPGPYRTQIFDRFVRINVGGGQVRGTGLGLTFCKLAIEAHGGRIWVADAEHGGSRFVFTLPGVPRF
jgi:PAS domain S-box-containing protein